MSEEESTKSGYIERILCEKKKKNRKFMWFSLFGSTLFSYSKPGSVQPKATYQIKGTTVTAPADKKLTLDITSGDKFIISLVATSKEEMEQWQEALVAATNLDSCDAPTKEKKKKPRGSVSVKIGKAMGDKMPSGPIKAAVKGVVNEETRLLIVSLKKIIAKVESRKVAEEIEDNLIKIITKSFFLEKDKKITLDQFLVADEPLRAAFETLVEMRDYRHRMRPETVKQRLKLVHDKLGSVEKIISAMLVDVVEVCFYILFYSLFYLYLVFVAHYHATCCKNLWFISFRRLFGCCLGYCRN